MTIPSLRPLSGLVPVLAALAVAVSAVTANAAPSAHAARAGARPTTCDVSRVADRLGPTSVTSLKVLHVRCGRAIPVVRAFHACRLANGPSGRCVRLVKGYACGEIRTNGPTQFTATATCRKGRASIVHRYTQVTA
jgi:hypothetical protein